MHSPSLMLPHGKCEEGGRGGGGNYAQPLTDAPSRDPPAEPGAVPLPPDRSLQWWAAAGRERARSPTYWPGMRGDGGGHHLKGASTGSPKALLLPDPASCPPPPPPLPLPLPAPAPSSRFYEPQGGGIFLDGRPAGSFSLGEWPSVGVEGGGIKHVLPYGGC